MREIQRRDQRKGNVLSQEAAARQLARRLQRQGGGGGGEQEGGLGGRSPFLTRPIDSIGIANNPANVAVVGFFSLNVDGAAAHASTRGKHIRKKKKNTQVRHTHTTHTHARTTAKVLEDGRDLIAQICSRRVIEAQACPLVFIPVPDVAGTATLQNDK